MSDQDMGTTIDPNDPNHPNNRPIILTLTFGKVNYILNSLAQLPYEKSFQPIQDIQQMVMAQMQQPWPPVSETPAEAIPQEAVVAPLEPVADTQVAA